MSRKRERGVKRDTQVLELSDGENVNDVNSNRECAVEWKGEVQNKDLKSTFDKA